MPKLTTHVLDTANGRPAAGMRVKLYVFDVERRRLVKSVVTNVEGRTVIGDTLPAGIYELVFGVADYFGTPGERPFLGEVVVRFGLDADVGSYHVPLLVAPYGYSTYRGS